MLQLALGRTSHAEYASADDYNSWQETSQSEDFKDKLDTEVILAEGT